MDVALKKTNVKFENKVVVRCLKVSVVYRQLRLVGFFVGGQVFEKLGVVKNFFKKQRILIEAKRGSTSTNSLETRLNK